VARVTSAAKQGWHRVCARAGGQAREDGGHVRATVGVGGAK
jgi:hypothetical protein